MVLVDALWGLPDGLQFLPHDSYQIDVVRNIVFSEKIRFKPRFVREDDDGIWQYVDVLVSKGRQKALGKRDVLEVATRTAAVAERLGAPAQIMWFCGIPVEYGVGRNIPWYRAREFADPSPRLDLRYKPIDVCGFDDLRLLPPRRLTIRLKPAITLVWDERFLDAVIEVAKSRNSPVALQGSRLGHTFYRLSAAGIAVIMDDRVQYYKKRGRKTYGKIVRDKIPAGITTRGEIVSEAVLAREDLIAGLAAKLCEESVEIVAATTREAQQEELADVNEVVLGLARAAEVSAADMELSAQRKRDYKGGFSERRVLLETSLPIPGHREETLYEVRLRDIAHVEPRARGVMVPFAALFAARAGIVAKVETDGLSQTIGVGLVPGGISIEIKEDGAAINVPEQMDMLERSGQARKRKKGE